MSDDDKAVTYAVPAKWLIDHGVDLRGCKPLDSVRLIEDFHTEPHGDRWQVVRSVSLACPPHIKANCPGTSLIRDALDAWKQKIKTAE